MDYYDYNVDLPFSKLKLNFREFNTEEQLRLAKANISFGNSRESLLSYHNYVLDIFEKCIKEKDNFKKINLIEYVLFLTKLRIISVGSTIEFLLNDTNKKTKIQIDLNQYLIDLYTAANYFEFEENNLLELDGFKIKIGWPRLDTINDFANIISDSKPEYQILNDSISEYVQEINLNDLKIVMSTLNYEQRTAIIDKTPLNIKLKIQEKILNACKKLFEADIFKISVFKDYKFNIYNLSFIEHIKMLFSYDLKSIYSEILYLANNNLNPEYVLKISNSERKLYITVIAEQNQKKDDNSNPNIDSNAENNSGYSDAVKKLALEFNQI